MHFVVFLCGVLGGVVPLGSGWWGQPDLLLPTAALPSWAASLTVVAIHLIAIAAIIGGTVVFVSAAASRIVLLSSSVGWLILLALLGHGVTPVAALLILVIAAGGFCAFLPGVQRPMLAVRDASLPRWGGDDPSVGRRTLFDRASKTLPKATAPARRAEPSLTPARSSTYDRSVLAPPARTGRPRSKREQRRTVLGVIGLVGVMVILFGFIVLNIQVFSPNATQILADVSSSKPVSTSTLAASSQVNATSIADVSSAKASTPPPETPDGASTAASPDLPPALPSEPERLLTQARGLPYGSLPSIVATDNSSFVSLPTVALASAAPSTSASAATSAAQPSGAQAAAASTPLPAHFATPDDYCNAVIDTDSPDASKISGGIAAMTTQARTQASLPQGEVRWRCMDHAAWVCVQPAGSLSCDKVPSSVDRVLICAAHPDTQGIRTAGGDWSCNGFTPVVSKDQLDAADHRGFDRGAWHKLNGDRDE